jgi:hypothetical protein
LSVDFDVHCHVRLVGILVTGAGAECPPDSCRDSGTSNAIGLWGQVTCKGSPVGAGVQVCMTDGTVWGTTCVTADSGWYYMYPLESDTSNCENAPNTTWTVVGNQCNPSGECFYFNSNVSWDGVSLQRHDMILAGGTCFTCP